MQLYLFVLGRDPQLSVLEAVTYLTTRGIPFTIKNYDDEVLLLEARPFAYKEVIKDLAGIQKIGTPISFENVIFTKDKIKYNVEYYGESDEEEFKAQLKAAFKEQKVKPIHKTIRGPSDLEKHRILQDGYEFLVYNDIIFKTDAVSNPRSYEERDKKPFFDVKRTISIRLARMLINIAAVKPGKTILDPYAGTGTIMQEAIILGINAIGIDSDKETCEGCNKNLYWVRKTYHTKAEWSIINKDARRLATYIDHVDAIVSEPYLGPFLRKLPSYKEALRFVEQLTKDYLEFLQQAAKVTNGKIVVVVPFYKTSDGRELKLPFKELVQKAGLKVSKPLKGFETPIRYVPPNTRLGRDIWILEK